MVMILGCISDRVLDGIGEYVCIQCSWAVQVMESLITVMHPNVLSIKMGTNCNAYIQPDTPQ